MNKWIVRSIILVVVILAPAGAFYYQFNALPPGNPESWGQFGDFVGGILNPVVAGMALLLLFENLDVTRKEFRETNMYMETQTDELELRRVREDLYRVISDCQHRLDALLGRQAGIAYISGLEVRRFMEEQMFDPEIEESYWWLEELRDLVHMLGIYLRKYESETLENDYTNYIRTQFTRTLINALNNKWPIKSLVRDFLSDKSKRSVGAEKENQ